MVLFITGFFLGAACGGAALALLVAANDDRHSTPDVSERKG